MIQFNKSPSVPLQNKVGKSGRVLGPLPQLSMCDVRVGLLAQTIHVEVNTSGYPGPCTQPYPFAVLIQRLAQAPLGEPLPEQRMIEDEGEALRQGEMWRRA
jgi:hypothetical protein